MIHYIRNFRLNQSVKCYIYQLGPAQALRYGTADQYTALQIIKTAKALGLKMHYAAYAVALYRHDQSENTLKFFKLNQADLDGLRATIADSLLDGKLHPRSRWGSQNTDALKTLVFRLRGNDGNNGSGGNDGNG